jgi:hypothetical protein
MRSAVLLKRRSAASNHSTFIVRSFKKESSIRSVLGFMSLATRWGDHLFPGITVLTRDLHDVKALHETAIRMGATNSPRKLFEFQRRSTDPLVARELSKILARENIKISFRELTQQMTHWQRYGSLIHHFGLLDQKHSKSVDGYRMMIFRDRFGPASDEPTLRKRRMKHFRWYRQNRANIFAIQPIDVQYLFRHEAGAWKRWWLTGLNPPAKVPDSICLVRELEFFFTVWQTLFEASAILLHETGRADASRSRSRRPLEDFLMLILRYRSNTQADWRRLVSVCLQLHERFVSPRLATWQKRAINLVGADKNVNAFIRLHNNNDIETFGAREPSELPEALTELHVAYCELQNKRHAVCAWSFKDRKPGPSYPALSAQFNSYRWGLFGYRFQASQTLWDSLKYWDRQPR